MRNYSNYLSRVLENKKLFELSMNQSKKDEINRIKSAGDFKSLLDIYNNDINNIKTELLKLNFDDIYIDNNDGQLTIEYNSKLYAILKAFEVQLFEVKENDDFINKIFQDGYRDLFLEVSLTGEFNQIDILNGLPNFMKKLGLGKKIYKKLIKDFNYISSFYGVEPGIDLTWNSILNDKEIYSFSNDDNLISFWNDFEYNKIVEKLKEFYKYDGMIKSDDDFLIKYNLSENDFKQLIK